MSGGSLAVLRAVVGVLGAVSCARLLVYGWVDEFWVRPAHRLSWPGIGSIPVPGRPWLHLVVALTGGLWAVGAARAVLRHGARPWLLAATAGSSYLGLLDVTPYLNHYVLLVALGALGALLPDGPVVPRWAVMAPRVLLATVYLWAAVAKLDVDWLSGRTLRPWLATHVDWPLVGPLLRSARPARLASWAGLVFDATITPFLTYRRTRRAAFGAVVLFHGITALSFPIGIFPWLMIGATTVFFAPEWPDRWWPAGRVVGVRPAPRLDRYVRFPVVAVLVVLALLPVRSVGSDVWWSEQGGRFSWRVMAVNKVGTGELVVVPTNCERPYVVTLRRDLSELQAGQVPWQPDLVLAWAHLVADLEATRTGGPVAVFGDIWISVNGRAPARFVDPTVDLAQEDWTATRPTWVLDPPTRSWDDD